MNWISLFTHQVSLFAELFNEMLQRDFGYRIYKALAAIPAKDDKKEKEKKVKKEAEKREVKKEKDEDSEEPQVKKAKDDEEDKKKASPWIVSVLLCTSFQQFSGSHWILEDCFPLLGHPFNVFEASAFAWLTQAPSRMIHPFQYLNLVYKLN